jgi:predicted outer membrane repeat protein
MLCAPAAIVPQQVDLFNSTMANNIGIDKYHIAGIGVRGAAFVRVDGCRFTNNTAATGGSAIRVLGDEASGNAPGTMRITNCTFEGNSATCSDRGPDCAGGAIAVYDNSKGGFCDYYDAYVSKISNAICQLALLTWALLAVGNIGCWRVAQQPGSQNNRCCAAWRPAAGAQCAAYLLLLRPQGGTLKHCALSDMAVCCPLQ